jgi:putative endonuclease
MAWVVYILECTDGSLYTGITNDLKRRLNAHEAGKGAKYTKRRGPFTVQYTESLNTKSAALQREAAIKSLDRSAKVALIASGSRLTCHDQTTHRSPVVS